MAPAAVSIVPRHSAGLQAQRPSRCLLGRVCCISPSKLKSGVEFLHCGSLEISVEPAPRNSASGDCADRTKLKDT
ncbi:hypothetical protein V8D89_000426 [Ganoderma adspersum]